MIPGRSIVRLAIYAIAIAIGFEWFFVRLLKVQMPGGRVPAMAVLGIPSFRGDAKRANPESPRRPRFRVRATRAPE